MSTSTIRFFGGMLGVASIWGLAAGLALAAEGDVRTVVNIENVVDASGSSEVTSSTDVEVHSSGGELEAEVTVNGEELMVTGADGDISVTVDGEVIEEVAGEVTVVGDTTVEFNDEAVTIKRQRIQAVTDLPVAVTEDSRVVVEVAGDQHEVRILLDEAADQVIEEQVVDEVTSSDGLVVVGGEVAYRLHGIKMRRLLGIWPVTVEVTTLVSAADGVVVETEGSGSGGLWSLIWRG